jgi:hypothetical protein
MSGTTVNDAVDFVLRTVPKHIDGNNRDELENTVRAMVGLGRYILAEGTGDRTLASMYQKVREKFCACYPHRHYPSTYEALRTAIQFPDEIVHYSPAHKFGLSKTRLKRYKERYAQYMRTRDIQCRECMHTKPGTDFSDGRLVGRRKRRVCKACIEGARPNPV